MIFVFLQNVRVEIMKKLFHVSDNSIGCFKNMHFAFEIGKFSGKNLVFLGAWVYYHTGDTGHSRDDYSALLFVFPPISCVLEANLVAT